MGVRPATAKTFGSSNVTNTARQTVASKVDSFNNSFMEAKKKREQQKLNSSMNGHAIQIEQRATKAFRRSSSGGALKHPTQARGAAQFDQLEKPKPGEKPIGQVEHEMNLETF